MDIWQAILADMFPDTVVPYPVIMARLLGGLVLGGIIGFEREVRDRPAGLRTHMLVSLSAAAFGVLAGEIANSPMFDKEQVQGDPLRILEAVTAGVAFLAAGFIVFSRGKVKGLTTAAGMWLAAAIGVSVGFGFWIVGLLAAGIGTIVLQALYRIEKSLDLK